jgi:hypothetical protein
MLAQPEDFMIDLSSQRWGQYEGNYTDGSTVAILLDKAYSGEMIDHWYEDLHQEICHQYTVSQVAFITAPHLVELAKKYIELRKPLLILLGICHAFAENSALDQVPADIRHEWDQSAQESIPLLLELLAEPQPTPSDFLYLLSSLAACSGYPSLARSLENLDYEAE